MARGFEGEKAKKKMRRDVPSLGVRDRLFSVSYVYRRSIDRFALWRVICDS